MYRKSRKDEPIAIALFVGMHYTLVFHLCLHGGRRDKGRHTNLIGGPGSPSVSIPESLLLALHST